MNTTWDPSRFILSNHITENVEEHHSSFFPIFEGDEMETPSSTLEVGYGLDHNPSDHERYVNTDIVPRSTPPPYAEQDDYPFLEELALHRQQEQPPSRPTTPLPAYEPFEFKPPEYDTPSGHYVHQGVWYCCRCQLSVGNSLRETELGLYDYATCGCGHRSCSSCIWDKTAFQPVPWHIAKKIKGLGFSRGMPYVVICPRCTFFCGAHFLQPPMSRRSRLKKAVLEGLLPVYNWAYYRPAWGRNLPSRYRACKCGVRFTHEWLCFRNPEGRFDPVGTSLRVLEILEDGMPEGERVALL
ncbi:hypothetical protein BU16DRAFT_557779 [Lophium mytilinum]|uniref:Uncharacterized protein n=1 Tax=Lophium mytilinum TaxID=390894 RepID=A0A6A6R4R1_9PEZI|nr:hypothetical protein BU16DRAFT_557779 [Lophium mytilinum]